MPALSQQLFVLLSSLVEERVGLHYAAADASLFADKIWSRLADIGIESPLDYYYFLRYDPGGEAELAALIDVLVVGETYLFREHEALRVAVEQVIRPAIDARRSARVWCAGCSTGEEPLSLAMLLAEEDLLDHVDLIATDVSHRALARARTGVLTSRSLRALSPTAPSPAPAWARRVAERWIEPTEGGGGRVGPELTRRIDFRRDNLLEPQLIALYDVDLIFCRNVLIYFPDATIRKVVAMFAERLRLGGRLVVGASESLLRFGTLLRCEERAGVFFYTKEPS
jgi:chemotaxis protein methyltransferase CheR